MKIAFRVDASIEIGTGHVMRCLTLADALRQQGHTCRFISRAHDGHLGEVIRQKGFTLHLLPQPETQEPLEEERAQLAHADWLGASWQADAEQTLGCIADEHFDWLVVDHYALDACWEAAVVPSQTRLLVIDDLADRHHLADVLLDQNLGRKASDYDRLVPDHCQRLIGPEFALLRPEFAQWREASLTRRRENPQLRHLLISLGGVDKDNVTGQVLEALASCELPDETYITVIVGSTAPWLEEVKAKAKALPWPTEFAVSVNDMARRMAEADLAIGAAGSTSWERCCLGLPTLMLVLAENQKEVACYLDQLGAAKLVGIPADLPRNLPVSISEMTGSVYTRMSEISSEITKANGVCSLAFVMKDFESILKMEPER
ncbi:UDP-2,4-diacetamido-2,4,6-trideoxy-beta-L-altropyranose hydrolase [Halomonas sp. CH40]